MIFLQIRNILEFNRLPVAEETTTYMDAVHLDGVILTYRLILLELKHSLIIAHRCVVIHILHQHENLHGWIHFVVIFILCEHHQDELETEPTEAQEKLLEVSLYFYITY